MIVDGFGGLDHQGYFAIYDGHGGRGAVDFTAKTLHKVFYNVIFCPLHTFITLFYIFAGTMSTFHFHFPS